MIYLCNIQNKQYICRCVFQNESEFAAWLTHLGNFDDILRRQRLTDTDTCKYREECWDEETDSCWNNVIELNRDICLIDEYGRTLDVRDYQHLIPSDTSIYNKWLERTYFQLRKAKSNRRQGRTHRRYYNYTHLSRYIEPDNELRNIAIRHCNRILRKQPICIEFIETAENNWKSRKVAHQYMWHKPRHKSTAEKSQEVFADD